MDGLSTVMFQQHSNRIRAYPKGVIKTGLVTHNNEVLVMVSNV